MSLSSLASYGRELFEDKESPKILLEEEKKINVVQRDPFLTQERIFRDVLPVIESNRIFILSLLGPQGSGKTICASNFATLAKNNGFRVVYALPDDFMKDMEGWIRRVLEDRAEKYCFVLDDLSYSMDEQSRKKQASIKNFIARFRHVFEGPIFLIFITHRLHAVPPMLRNSATFIFSSMQSGDREDAIKLIPRRKEMRERLDNIASFISKATIEGPRDGTFTFSIGDTERKFRWGKKDDPGDGRLMATYHSGDMKIFNSQVTEDMIDLLKYRIVMTEQLDPIVIQNDFENLAEEILPITNETKMLVKPEF